MKPLEIIAKDRWERDGSAFSSAEFRSRESGSLAEDEMCRNLASRFGIVPATIETLEYESKNSRRWVLYTGDGEKFVLAKHFGRRACQNPERYFSGLDTLHEYFTSFGLNTCPPFLREGSSGRPYVIEGESAYSIAPYRHITKRGSSNLSDLEYVGRALGTVHSGLDKLGWEMNRPIFRRALSLLRMDTPKDEEKDYGSGVSSSELIDAGWKAYPILQALQASQKGIDFTWAEKWCSSTRIHGAPHLNNFVRISTPRGSRIEMLDFETVKQGSPMHELAQCALCGAFEVLESLGASFSLDQLRSEFDRVVKGYLSIRKHSVREPDREALWNLGVKRLTAHSSILLDQLCYRGIPFSPVKEKVIQSHIRKMEFLSTSVM